MAPVTVSPPTPAELTAACTALFAHRRGAERCRDLVCTGELDPAGLFVAKDDHGVIRGAVLVQTLPGAMGLAWPPRAEPGPDQRTIEDELVSVACGWLRGRGVKVCQAFAA